jgi:Uma2 family endonuclease
MVPCLHPPAERTTILSPADLELDGSQSVQPELFVGALVGGRESLHWSEFGIPLLIAEVLSPSTARHDRLIKRQLYQRCGVPCYWVVDLDARLIEVWSPGAASPLIASDRLTWHPEPDHDPLAIELVAFFREACGDLPA